MDEINFAFGTDLKQAKIKQKSPPANRRGFLLLRLTSTHQDADFPRIPAGFRFTSIKGCNRVFESNGTHDLAMDAPRARADLRSPIAHKLPASSGSRDLQSNARRQLGRTTPPVLVLR